MSSAEVRRVWRDSKEHVDNMLSHAKKLEEMQEFVDLMLDYYETKLGCGEEVCKELKILMGERCLHYGLQLKAELRGSTVTFTRGKECCIVLPIEELGRVKKILETRNKALSEKAQIMYRFVQ